MEIPSNFMSKTVSYHSRIEHGLSDVLGRFSDSSFFEPLTYALAGGKRLRPLILLLSYEAVGTGKPLTDNPMPAAAAVELLHTESIIDDDIIDKDILRREKDAFHKKYGFNTAILSADFVLGIVLDIASQYPDSRIGRELSKAVLRMSDGEHSELKIIKERKKIRLDEYISVIEDKTASLFHSTTKIGAVVAGAKQQTIESLSDFGLNLGTAYQIRDDLVDWKQDSYLERVLGARQEDLRKMSETLALNARKALSQLQPSEARQLLEDLSRFSF